MLKTGPQLRQSSVKAAEHSGKQEQKVTGRTELRKSLSAKGPEFELMGQTHFERASAYGCGVSGILQAPANLSVEHRGTDASFGVRQARTRAPAPAFSQQS